LPAIGVPDAPWYDPHELEEEPLSRRHLLHVLSQTFWILALGVICLFAFFLLTGAVSPTGAVGLSLGVLVLVGLWIAHAVWEARHRTGRDAAAVRARERRGF
jgi:uncharacterized membrane protein (DUF485 family)